MLPNLDPLSGCLPHGRFQATADEVAAQYATNEHRIALWSQWLAATEVLRGAVLVSSAWLGGSYFSTKDEPGDIDCVYVVDVERIELLEDSGRALLQFFANNQLRNVFGYQIDSFLLAWQSNPTTAPRGPQDYQYLQARGYWDDLWSKMRTGNKNSQPTRLDSLPRRGYLEVMLDGYS